MYQLLWWANDGHQLTLPNSCATHISKTPEKPKVPITITTTRVSQYFFLVIRTWLDLKFFEKVVVPILTPRDGLMGWGPLPSGSTSVMRSIFDRAGSATLVGNLTVKDPTPSH